MKNLKLKLYFSEILIYLVIQALGLFVGVKLFSNPEVRAQAETHPISLSSVLISFGIATILIFLAVRFLKKGVFFQIFIGFLIFFGSMIVFESLLGDIDMVIRGFHFGNIPVLFLAIICIYLYYLHPKVITQNIAIGLAISGAGVMLGLNIQVWEVLVLLVILSVYDIIAVWKTKYMMTLFKGLEEKGVIMAFIIPSKIKDVFANLNRVQTGEEFLILGTGDVVFPIIFAVSALKYSLWSSIAIILGALLGLSFIHFFFIARKERKPIPALPPISIGSALGFFISLLFI